MPGVVADLHCKAAHKAPVGSDSGPDPAVPGGAGPSTELCWWQGDNQDTLTEVCSVTAGLALRMHTLCPANTALGCPGSAAAAATPCAGLKGSEAGAVPWAGQGAQEAARARSALLLPQVGMAEKQGFCLPHARVALRFFSA